MTDACITGIGAYLPGEPVDNERAVRVPHSLISVEAVLSPTPATPGILRFQLSDMLDQAVDGF